jgi:uroporphyrinogen decarboxylase
MKYEGLRPDRMTQQERMIALFEGKPMDRIPVMLFYGGSFFFRNAGIRNFFPEPKVALEAQLLGLEMYRIDGQPGYGWAERNVWVFGGEYKPSTSDYQQTLLVSRYPVQSEEDAWNLKLPDVKTSEFFVKLMEFCRLLEDRGFTVQCLENEPFHLACTTTGVPRFFQWMKEKPEICHHLLRLAVEHAVNVAQYWVDTFGKDRVMWATDDGISSEQHISIKQFEEFAFPYSKEMHERILALGVLPHIFSHLCGAQLSRLPYCRQIPYGGAGLINIGELTDLSKAIEAIGDIHIILGNVSSKNLLHGTPEEVYEETRQCIEIGKKSPRGFILMPSCEVPPMTPPANLWAMRKAVNDFGWYD